MQAIGANKYGNITQDELQTVLDNNTGDGEIEVIDNGDTFVVKFIESERYYEVDSNGNVSKYAVIIDSNPGNITIGINGETLEGTEESPYEIWCIEDLVEWSNNYSTYQSKYIILCTTLNFKSSLSYTDSTRTDYGDLNGDGTIEDILTELTKTDDGCAGFTPITNFAGTFDGQGYEIKNIYVNISGNAGLFVAISGTVQNLEISGEIISTENNAGGIVAGGNNGTIVNCNNSANITASSSAGGIKGSGYSDIQNCCNSGNIEANIAGGIIGNAYGTVMTLTNCYNTGTVSGKNYAGGILAYNGGDVYQTIIINCYNTGNIIGNSSSSYVGGILGFVGNFTVEIQNSYNLGKVESEYYAGGLIGHTRYTAVIKNCYSGGKISGNGTLDVIVASVWNNNTVKLTNFYYDEKTVTDGVSIFSDDAIGFNSSDEINEMINVFNSYTGDDEEYPSEWSKWVLGDDGYPTFE